MFVYYNLVVVFESSEKPLCFLLVPWRRVHRGSVAPAAARGLVLVNVVMRDYDLQLDYPSCD
jgi:hypothetical protein